MKPFALILLTAMAFGLATEAAQACPSCVSNLPSGEAQVDTGIDASERQPTQLAQGFAWSVIFMMAMPFVLAGTFGGVWYLRQRQ